MISDELKSLIRNLYHEYPSYRKVASLAKVSDKTVRAVILNLHVQDKKRPGPSPAIKTRDERSIIREMKKLIKRKERVTAPKIQSLCNLEVVSTRTVQRKLKSMGNKYSKATRQIVLKPEQKRKRLECARKWILERVDWSKVIWTDEKRFSADGPDSWCSWTPIGESLVRNKRQQGGPAIQVWGMLLPGPLVVLFELPLRGDPTDYMDFIEFSVLPAIKHLVGHDFLFQQDNAPTHSSKFSIERFTELGIDLLEWPARSPDLNLIENVWSMLSEIVYDGRQFESKAELWSAIDLAVSKINTEFRDKLENIISSIDRRVLKVVEREGDKIDY